MRLLVTGSRDWSGVYGTARIEQVLNIILALTEVLGVKLTVVHGDCPSGADQIVDRWARRRDSEGVVIEAHPADWSRFQRSAGPIRNQEMVDRGADLCIGFVKGNSLGTRHCLSLARNAKIPTFTINWEEEERE